MKTRLFRTRGDKGPNRLSARAHRALAILRVLSAALLAQAAICRSAHAACELFVTSTTESGGIIRMSTAGDMPRPLNVPGNPKRIASSANPTPQLFWIQENDHNIYTAETDGTGFRVLQAVGDFPTALTVFENQIFISEHSADPLSHGVGKILRMGIDGTDLQVIVTGQNYITGITTQFTRFGAFLYWTTVTEQNEAISHGAVYGSGLDGSGVGLVIDLNARSADLNLGGSSYPADISSEFQYLYIADNISSDPSSPHVVYGAFGELPFMRLTGEANRITSIATDDGPFHQFVTTAGNGIMRFDPELDQLSIKVSSFTGTGIALLRGANCNSAKGLTGSSLTDFVVFRPSNGRWYIRSNNGLDAPEVTTPLGVQWGLPGDIPKILNFSGDRVADIAVFRPREGNWYICNSWHGEACIATQVVQFGLPGDIPVADDFDGDGLSDLTVYRPKEGRWYTRYSRTLQTGTVDWGLPGDVPIGANRLSNGRYERIVWRPFSGLWYTQLDPFGLRQLGLPGDVPMYGPYGVQSLAVFRPSNSRWYLCVSGGQFSNDCNAAYSVQFGFPKDIPVRGNFSADPNTSSPGPLDLAVYRPSEGAWYFNNQSVPGSAATRVQWGLSGDIPVTN